MIYDVLIVGGGASGLMAACALAGSGARVALLEKQPRVGRKLLSTGNGRCNFTNLRATAANYHGSADLARAALAVWPPERIVETFRGLGVFPRPDAEGRVYPASNQAAAVLDALRLRADEAGCETLCDFAVAELRCRKGLFVARAADGRAVEARFALVCAGGLAAPKLGACGDGYRLLEAFGHRITPRRPALTPLKTPPEAVRALKGLRVQGRFRLYVDGVCRAEEAGEALFADAGVSGIAAMQLARPAGEALARGRRVALEFDLWPDGTDQSSQSPQSPEAALNALCRALPERPAEDLLTGLVPKRVGQALLKAAGVAPLTRPAKSLTDAERRAVAAQLRGWRLPVTGVQGFEQAQVTAGGADGRDFDPATLESRRAPGLFAAGEVLDVDGDCGGFNLQWAWASALTCAGAILPRLGKERAR